MPLAIMPCVFGMQVIFIVLQHADFYTGKLRRFLADEVYCRVGFWVELPLDKFEVIRVKQEDGCAHASRVLHLRLGKNLATAGQFIERGLAHADVSGRFFVW